MLMSLLTSFCQALDMQVLHLNTTAVLLLHITYIYTENLPSMSMCSFNPVKQVGVIKQWVTGIKTNKHYLPKKFHRKDCLFDVVKE